MKYFFLSALLAVCGAVCAQNRISDHNTIGWYTLIVSPKINEKLSGHIELQWRRNHVITSWQQSLVRAGLTYKLNSQVALQAGYGWSETFPYSEHFVAGVRKTFPEHRIYEQVVLTNFINKVKLSNRLRIEQRWNGVFTSLDDKTPHFLYLNRVRFMPRIDVPLDKKNKLYAALYDEIFVQFGKNVGQNVLDQNRIGIVAGYTFSKKLRLEGGFINQTLQYGRQIDGKNVFQYNNGLIINAYVNL